MSRCHFLERPASPIRSILGGLAVMVALTGQGCGEPEAPPITPSDTPGAAKSLPSMKPGEEAASGNKDLMQGIPKKDR